MHVVYLHGFASSPQSSKATFFAGRLAERGIRMECPDLNDPDFSTLTVSRMLRQLETRLAALPPDEVVPADATSLHFSHSSSTAGASSTSRVIDDALVLRDGLCGEHSPSVQLRAATYDHELPFRTTLCQFSANR